MPFPFLSLPRELRDNVYQLLLAAGGPIYLASLPRDSPMQILRIKGQTTMYGRKDRMECLDTALLYVNRQISWEALEILYASNTFHVPQPLTHFVYWLKALPAQHRDNIRNLEFMQRLFMPLLFDNSESWSELISLIIGRHSTSQGRPMRFNRITVSVPLDHILYEPSQALSMSKLMSNAPSFWWPSLKFFAGLLEKHDSGTTTVQTPSLNMLLIKLPDYDKHGPLMSYVPVLRPLKGADAVDISHTSTIRLLRFPRMSGDEMEEDRILEVMRSCGLRGRDTKLAWIEYHAQPHIKSRPKLSFRAYWIDGQEGRCMVLSNRFLRLNEAGNVRGEYYGMAPNSSTEKICN